jgi:seryl-tRNA(Sec) selenium transferase
MSEEEEESAAIKHQKLTVSNVLKTLELFLNDMATTRRRRRRRMMQRIQSLLLLGVFLITGRAH